MDHGGNASIRAAEALNSRYRIRPRISAPLIPERRFRRIRDLQPKFGGCVCSSPKKACRRNLLGVKKSKLQTSARLRNVIPAAFAGTTLRPGLQASRRFFHTLEGGKP